LTVGGAELEGVSYSNKEGSRRVLVGPTPPRALRGRPRPWTGSVTALGRLQPCARDLGEVPAMARTGAVLATVPEYLWVLLTCCVTKHLK
jgi:hypothetical protein